MRIIVLGGGACGLGTAVLLARDDHDVTVVERDASPPPETPQEAWEAWERKGVAQFRQPHVLVPGLRRLLEAELPDLEEALVDAGAARWDLVNPLPPSFEDRSPRPVDDRLWSHTARRPVVERVFAEAAHNERRLTIRRGIRGVGLLTGPPVTDGIPHVTGVATVEGEELHADLVVDATGRRSKSPDWLTAVGARRPFEEREDSGFTYYSRFFRGDEPQRRGPVLTPIGTISVLTLPGDNDTWSVTIYTSAGDGPLKPLRHADNWTAAVSACPLHAQWLEGEPITGVLPMSGVVDRYRRFVVDGTPVATGFVAVADAWACTNPSAGRGLTVGLLHARRLRDVVRDAVDDQTVAIIVEPIQGEGGVNVPDDEYLPGLRALCDERDLLLIFDEVWTGCGRTGQWFAHQHWDVTPDIMTLAKGAGGGLPVGVLCATQRVAECYDAKKHGVKHATTLGGNCLSMAVCATIFEVIERDGLLLHAAAMGKHAAERFEALARSNPVVKPVRGRGLFLGVQLDPAAEGATFDNVSQVVQRCLDAGVLINGTQNTILRIAPPLTITQDELDRGLDVVEKAIAG